MVTIDVVVPVYGNWELTESCLRHLALQTVPHRVIVVDDCSLDDTPERVRHEFPGVTLVQMPVNRGFAAAANAGCAAGDGEIVVLVNNDVDAEPTMLASLVAPFESPEVGSACALLLRPDGLVDSFGICADVTRAGFVRLHGASLDEIENDAYALLGPYGAVAAYRRRAINSVGFLDEGIVMYGEELDLAFRLRNAGWASVAVPAARGVHIGGATSGLKSARQRRMAGFGRGYILRVYGVMRSRWAMRALATELGVSVLDLVKYRDGAAGRGRVEGWCAARHVERRDGGTAGIDMSIGFIESLQMRRGRIKRSARRVR